MNKYNKTNKSISQFEAIEQVVLQAEDSKLSPAFFEKANPLLQVIADKQELTMEQALMLCLVMNFCDSGCVKLRWLLASIARCNHSPSQQSATKTTATTCYREW